MKTNITEIAQRAGVSVATVSRALNNKGSVHQSTRKRVLDIAREIDYRPGLTLSFEPIKKTKTIGLALPGISDDFYSSIGNAIDQAAKTAGYHLLISATHSQKTYAKEIISLMEEKQIDGLLLMAPLIRQEISEVANHSNLPIVTMNMGNMGINLPGFGIDNHNGAYAVVEHLINHGYRKIAMIQGPDGNFDAEARNKGYRQALAKYDIPFKSSFSVNGDFSNQGGYYAFCRLMSQPEKPEAIFAANDMMAIGCYDAAKSMSLNIPEDVAIAAFDDIYIGRLLSPQLTTAHVPIEELGIKAFQCLKNIIEGEIQTKQPFYEELSVGLIVRESCGCKPK